MKIEEFVRLLNNYEEEASEEYDIEATYKFIISNENNIIIEDMINWREFDEFESNCIIFSKGYEFIAWLVENKNTYLKEYEAVYSPLDWKKIIRFKDWPTIHTLNWNLYDSILGALAISINPMKLLFDMMK